MPILSYKFSFLVPYVSIRRTRENLFNYFRECILGDHILNFHNLHDWIAVGAWIVDPICLWFADSQPLAKYIASLDPRYSSLFMDNVWKEAFEHSDTTVGESVASFFCLLIMKSGYFVMIVYYSATRASDQRVRPAIRRFLSDHLDGIVDVFIGCANVSACVTAILNSKKLGNCGKSAAPPPPPPPPSFLPLPLPHLLPSP